MSPDISPVLHDFQKAIQALKEVLELEKSDVIRDSAIKRFELCFDLAWKSIKGYARTQGVECNSPRSCFKTAFQLGAIPHEEVWLEMIDDRNLTAHLYKEEYAEKVYARLKDYSKFFQELRRKLFQQ